MRKPHVPTAHQINPATIVLNGVTWTVESEGRFFLHLTSGRSRASIRKGDVWHVLRTNGEREIITEIGGTHPALAGAKVENGNIRIRAEVAA